VKRVLYGFFALEAGGFYKVEVSKMSQVDVDSLAIKMAIVGVRVDGFTGRARSSSPPFTPQRERASGKALAFLASETNR
jgi:hypothetical protein